uniref:Large ribosomal subunit protein bL12 oligomerization domain-containing protein n=1 Tax=Xenopus tropicalis TaxID=8364 RepID=F6QQ99_XENTR
MLPVTRCCLRLQAVSSALRRFEISTVRLLRTTSELKNQALPSPSLDNAPKEYPPKIHNLVDQIASLTLLEVSEFNELLRKTLKIQDVGMMPMGSMLSGATAAPSQAAEEAEAPGKKEKTHFTVKLTEVNATDKVKLIKEVKNCIQGLNLVQRSMDRASLYFPSLVGSSFRAISGQEARRGSPPRDKSECFQR